MKEGYAFCLNEWALDKSIKSELGLLIIISSLSARTGHCFASNSYLSELFEIDEVSVSRKIKKLIDKGYLSVEYDKRGAEIKQRRLRLTKMLTDDLQKDQSTINKNVKDNNINNNNINNKKEKIYKKETAKKTLFKNSEFFEFEKFEKKMISYNLDNEIDFSYYYNAVNDWSESKDVKRTANGWLATARTFMRKDLKDGKIKKTTDRPKVSTDLTDQEFLDFYNL